MTARAMILSRAFGRLGLGDYEFDIKPEERAMARVSLDGMMAEWAAQGVDLGYVPSANDNDSAETGTPGWADDAIWCNLALRIAPDFGKQPAGSLVRAANRGYALAASRTMSIPAQQGARSNLRGAGDRFYRRFGW